MIRITYSFHGRFDRRNKDFPSDEEANAWLEKDEIKDSVTVHSRETITPGVNPGAAQPCALGGAFTGGSTASAVTECIILTWPSCLYVVTYRC